MPKLFRKEKDRLICFRVSQAEHTALEAAAAAAGHSSLSPWIRQMLRVGPKRRTGSLASPATLTDLEIRVAALEKRASR